MEVSTEGERPDMSESVMAAGKRVLDRGGCRIAIVPIETEELNPRYYVQVTHESTLEDIRRQLSKIPAKV